MSVNTHPSFGPHSLALLTSLVANLVLFHALSEGFSAPTRTQVLVPMVRLPSVTVTARRSQPPTPSQHSARSQSVNCEPTKTL